MNKVVEVLLPLPFENTFKYYILETSNLEIGNIIKVSFGKKNIYGVILEIKNDDEISDFKIKPIIEKLSFLKLESNLLQFIKLVASYNIAIFGLVLKLSISILNNKTSKKLFIETNKVPIKISPKNFNLSSLNPAQQEAQELLWQKFQDKKYSTTLLDGVTGSGKTEVYFNLIGRILQNNQSQILILLPEINLTTQLINRFQQKFSFEPAVWHSKISPAKKNKIFHSIINGNAKVIIGARSALFLPFKKLGLIIVDEEHDGSFKQEDAINYHGRDMAVLKAKIENIPIILCSATPSLESLVNSRNGKYNYISLTNKFVPNNKTSISLIDLKSEKLKKDCNLSVKLLRAISENLDKKQQTLLFLNRRGYSPLVLCKSCGHKVECMNCSSYMTYHQDKKYLICHHCGYSRKFHHNCLVCKEEDSIITIGVGIEKLKEEVEGHFPEAKTLLISSDDLTDIKKSALILEQIYQNKVDIIIGTQIISKGYHFPMLSLVGVVDADSSFFNGDLRTTEKAYQLLTQVIGRAGRESIAGQVFLQTYNPDNIVFRNIVANHRNNFFKTELKNREIFSMPPFTKMVAVVFSDDKEQKAMESARKFAVTLRKMAIKENYAKYGFDVLGPSPMALLRFKRKYHYRLLLKHNRNFNIQEVLRSILTSFKSNSTRIKVDIDFMG